jgi:hypothetical protein
MFFNKRFHNEFLLMANFFLISFRDTLYRCPQKKKTSPKLPYLSDDFNYLYIKLNGCE